MHSSHFEMVIKQRCKNVNVARLSLLNCNCTLLILRRVCWSFALNIGSVSNEANTDVHMCIEEFILVDVVTLLYKDEVQLTHEYE